MKKWELKATIRKMEEDYAELDDAATHRVQSLSAQRDDSAAKLQDACVQLDKFRVRINELEADLGRARANSDAYVVEGPNRKPSRIRIVELEQELSDTRLKLKAKDEAIGDMQKLAEQRLSLLNVAESNLRSATNLAHSHYRNWIQEQTVARELEKKLAEKNRNYLTPSELRGAGQVVMVPIKRYRELLVNEGSPYPRMDNPHGGDVPRTPVGEAWANKNK